MRVGIAGCGGRMGRQLVDAVRATTDCRLIGGTVRPGGSAAPPGIDLLDSAHRLFPLCDAVIDFTLPAATVAHAELAARHGVVLVVGTTGLSPEDEGVLRHTARRVPVVYAANFNPGLTLLLSLVERAASILDTDYDIEIVEAHHRHKVDAPSGTALVLGRAAALGREASLDSVWCKTRDGHTGVRPRGQIGFATLRGGDVVGDHTVMFAAEGERVELTHKASSRAMFAKGAVRAARRAAGRTPGLYTMRDVLGL